MVCEKDLAANNIKKEMNAKCFFMWVLMKSFNDAATMYSTPFLV
jgi:hypothetical protein